VDALSGIAERRGLRLLFDAAHAFGCSYKGRMIGGFGDAEVFSFHATKVLNTFEGGAVITNSDELATRTRLMTNFGFTGYDQVECIGINGKMSEVSAAMGLTGLESIDDFVCANRRNYREYERGLEGIPGVQLIAYDGAERCNYQYVILTIDEAITQASRDQVIEILQAENVLARRYFYPGCHRMQPYRSLFPDAGVVLPETESVAERVISLPTGTAIRPEDVRVICQIMRMVLAHGPEVRRRLGVARNSHRLRYEHATV
jgi:dTDP-4-amino-4,6-dideoxygalactose transaminase